MPDFIVRAARQDEMYPVGILTARIFHHDAPDLYHLAVQHFCHHLPRKPGFQPAMYRVGVLDGQIVALTLIETRVLRYGSARLRVGTVSSVCTHPAYRKRGYASAVMRDCLTYMAEQGVHLALLNGLPGYYERFGFSPVWPDYAFEVRADEAAALETPSILRGPRPDDLPFMADLYERHWSGRVTFARSPELWAWRLAARRWPVQVVEDVSGQITGYIMGDDLHPSERFEVIADHPDAAMTLLSHAGQRCRQNGSETVRWPIPPDDALVNFARQLGSVTVSARYHPSGGWMARLIDTRALIDTLLPELIAQAQTVIGSLQAADLLLSGQPDVVQIGLRGQKTTHCRLNHHDFIQIMFGSLRPAALAARPHSQLHPDAVRLLEALFPPRMAALAGWDWF